MKLKTWAMILCLSALTGCTALDGKCDYIPPNDCGCSVASSGMPYPSCQCQQYNARQAKVDLYHCGGCSCVGDTCSQCWSCGKQYQFHDQ